MTLQAVSVEQPAPALYAKRVRFDGVKFTVIVKGDEKKLTTTLLDTIHDVHNKAPFHCPDCSGLLVHSGMTVPVYDCADCKKEWQVTEAGEIRAVTDGCAVPTD